jgi:hypothetical protein
LVTGSLQVKGLVYYIVLNVYPNNKRNQKWIPTTVIANGKKVNQIKAEKLLSDIRMIYDKDSYIDKKTAGQLLEEQNQSKPTTLSLLPKISNNNKTEQLRLSNQTLSNETDLVNKLSDDSREQKLQKMGHYRGVVKFQYILTNYNENEIYKMENQILNNLYEDIESLNQIKNVVVTA